MAACRACLTPHPRVPPARPDSSAACCWLLSRSMGGWGLAPRLASRSRKKGQSARSDFPAFSSFISPAISPASHRGFPPPGGAEPPKFSAAGCFFLGGIGMMGGRSPHLIEHHNLPFFLLIGGAFLGS